jgi:hypothetical protein
MNLAVPLVVAVAEEAVVAAGAGIVTTEIAAKNQT